MELPKSLVIHLVARGRLPLCTDPFLLKSVLIACDVQIYWQNLVLYASLCFNERCVQKAPSLSWLVCISLLKYAGFV